MEVGGLVIEPPSAGASLAGATISIPAGPAVPRTPRPPPGGPGLVANSRFEQGEVHFASATRELAVPSHWVLTHHVDDTPLLPGQAGAFGRPVTALINSLAVPAADRERLFAEGPFLWKVTGVTDPLWIRLAQTLTGVPPGQPLQLEAHVLPDLWVAGGAQPSHAADPLAGEARLVVDSGGQVFEGGWQSGAQAPFGRFTWLSLGFTAPAAQATIALELRTRQPLPLGAWYVAEIRVVAGA
jgi:hypothetical protein